MSNASTDRNTEHGIAPADEVRGQSTKPQRILACLLCQQRKVRCDRKVPCTNCTKSGSPCTSVVPQQRRRRFPERELLQRLRQYEGLLRQHNVVFEPMHPRTAGHMTPNTQNDDPRPSMNEDSREPDGTRPRAHPNVKTETHFAVRDVWNALNAHVSVEDDDDDSICESLAYNESLPRDGMHEGNIRKAMDQLYESNDHLLFGSRKINIELTAFHPQQLQIFRLWQIYLDNVNPLLKVIHTPTLQPRIMDAASDVSKIDPTLEALLFSIYCVAVISLDEEECLLTFKSSRSDLLMSYQFACQQALLNCGAMKSSDRESLAALFLFLVRVNVSN